MTWLKDAEQWSERFLLGLPYQYLSPVAKQLVDGIHQRDAESDLRDDVEVRLIVAVSA